MAKATIKELKAFFETNPATSADVRQLADLKVTMQELKDLKSAGAYDAIAEGIGDGSLTY